MEFRDDFLGERPRVFSELFGDGHDAVGLVIAEFRDRRRGGSARARPRARSTASDRISGTEGMGEIRRRLEDGEHLFGAMCVFQLLTAILVAEESGKRGEGLEMVLELSLGRQEQDAEANGLAVQRLKINRRFEAGDDGNRVLDA